MMHRTPRIGIFAFTFAIILSILACGGSAQVTQPPPPPSPTSPPPPTNTSPAPLATNTQAPQLTQTDTGPGPNSVAGQINVLEVTGFKDDSDYWYFYGLIRNDTDRTVSDVEVEVKLLDANAAILYTYTTYSSLYYLGPGESSPFKDFTTEPFPTGATVQATVVGNGTSDPLNRANLEYRGVTLWADEYNDVYLAGEVINNSADPVQVNGIAGTLVDASGKVVTASTAYPYLNHIEPGKSGPFVMMFDAPTGQAASLTSYNLYTDAVITDPVTTYDLTLSDEHYKYLDSFGDMHLIGSVTNNSSVELSVYLVAGIYDANGNVIDANSVYMPVPLAPGETLPYDFDIWGSVDYVSEAYAAASQYQIFFDWYSIYETFSPAYNISTSDDTNTFDGSTATFSGNVLNNSGRDLDSATVIVALYDKGTGKLIATNYTYVSGPIANNATGSYEVYLYTESNIDSNNVQYVITAKGQ